MNNYDMTDAFSRTGTQACLLSCLLLFRTALSLSCFTGASGDSFRDNNELTGLGLRGRWSLQVARISTMTTVTATRILVALIFTLHALAKYRAGPTQLLDDKTPPSENVQELNEGDGKC